MSSNLYWRPFGYGEKALPDELKFVLQKSEYNHNGIDTIIRSHDLPYFRGLQDAGVKGASKIVEALEKYDEVEIKEVY